MYYIFEINFNRAQQQIKTNIAFIRNILFLMKSTEILTTIMYSSTYKLKGNILAKIFLYIQIVHFAEVWHTCGTEKYSKIRTILRVEWKYKGISWNS